MIIPIGWYDVGQSEPTYDPGVSVPCPLCGHVMVSGSGDVRTISISPAYSAARSVFYRTHRSCAEESPRSAVEELDEWVLKAVQP